MQNIYKIQSVLLKHTYTAVALQLLFAIVLVALPHKASALVAGQLTSRSITMSDSSPSGGSISSGVGSGANVMYKVQFTVSSSSTVGGIVVDFCSTGAISFDTCTAPTGFNANTATTSINSQTNLGAGAFSIYTTSPVANRIIVTRATATLPSGVSSFELGNGTSNGFTNPSTTGTFYARIYTYDTAAHAQAHSQTIADTFVADYGGIALSTTTVITITARVQENLLFCVFGGVAPNNNCAAAGGSTAPALTIGHNSTGGTKYIDATVVDTADAYMQISTNAASGAIVRMHNSVGTGGLSSGGGVIPPSSSGSNAPAAISAGTAAFGLFVATGSGGVGSLVADANYNDGTSTHYGMDSTTSGDNVTTSYGDTIATTNSLPAANVNSTLTFAATASPVTPAGLYTANLSLIATGTF